MKLVIVGTICVALTIAAMVQILRVTGESASPPVELDQTVEQHYEELQQEVFAESSRSPDPGPHSLPNEYGNVVGQVIDAESKSPIRYFYVHVFESDQWIFSTESANVREYDSSLGHFTVEDTRFVEIDMLIRAKGYAPTTVRNVLIRNGTNVGIIALSPARELRGVVRESSTGDPIAGAKVSVLGLSQDVFGARRLSLPGQITETSDDGVFGFYELPDYEVYLYARADGFAGTRYVLSADVNHEVEILMPQAATIAGQIIGIDGSSPTTGGVRLIWENGRDFRSGRTNDAGYFSMQGLEPGKYEIRATSKDGFSEPIKLDLKPASKIEDLRLVVTRGSRLSGRVIGVFPDEGRLKVSISDSSRSTMVEQRPNSEGQYEFANLRPGTYHISATTRWRQISREVIVSPDSETYADLIFE